VALKDEAARAGRDPDKMLLCNLVLPVTAETKAAAEDKIALLEELPLDIDQLSLLPERQVESDGARVHALQQSRPARQRRHARAGHVRRVSRGTPQWLD
jgi:alkanesulfonate monooxygenase SsuD/methylene tetrahydromethanopterin reductase-like flavin-dependent oxidoreductase (luciferase family)